MRQKKFWVVFLMLLAGFGVLRVSGAEERETLGTHGDFLRSKISAASPLTEEEKTALVNFTQGQYQSGVSFKDKWNSGWGQFFEENANDASKNLESMKAAIREYWEQKRQENKPSLEEARAGARDLRYKMKRETVR
jgi:gas vesicle protein